MYEQPYNPFVRNLTTVKDYFKSPSVLALGIVKALGTILSIIGAILLSTRMGDVIAYFRSYILYVLDQSQAPSSARSDVIRIFDQIGRAPESSTVLASLPALVVPLLVVAAILIIYFNSRNQTPTATPMAGFTILFVFAILSLVGVIIAAVGILALIGLLFVVQSEIAAGRGPVITELRKIPEIADFIKNPAYWTEDEVTALLAVIIVLLVAVVISFFFILFTAINRMRYYGSVRKSLSTVDLQNKGAAPYGVMCILAAISSGLSLISSFSLLFAPHLKGRSNPLIGLFIVLMLSTAASVAGYILEAKLALGYKRHIDNVKFGYNTPAAPAAPYMPYGTAAGAYTPQAPPQNNPYVPFAPPVNPAPMPETDGGRTENPYADPYGAQTAESDELRSVIRELTEEEPQNTSEYEPISEPEIAPAPEETPEAPAEKAAPAEARICPLCGSEVNDDAAFCGNCGSRL